MSDIDVERLWSRAAAECDAALSIHVDLCTDAGFEIRMSVSDDLAAAKQLHAESLSAGCVSPKCACRHAALVSIACRRAVDGLGLSHEAQERAMDILFDTAMEMIELYLEGRSKLNSTSN